MYNLNPLEENRRTPSFALIAMGVLIVVTIVLFVFIVQKQPNISTHTSSLEFVEVAQEVALNQDIVIGVNNATVYIPKGATTTPGVISVTPREPNLFSNAAEKGWFRSPVVNVEYWNGQGTPYPQVSFTMPVQICFKITNELWQTYSLHPDEFQVHYYAEDLNPPRWQLIPLVAYPDRFQLCGQTDHLSIFALAVRQERTVPVTGSSPVPNSTPTPYTIINFFSNLFGLDTDDTITVPNPIVPPATKPTATEVPPTATEVPPSVTPVPSDTDTPVPPDTDTPVPPDTDTPAPPDDRPPVPPDTDTPVPTCILTPRCHLILTPRCHLIPLCLIPLCLIPLCLIPLCLIPLCLLNLL